MLFVAIGFFAAAATGASAETRSLKLHHLHTGEQAEIVFKRNGRYDPDGLKKINLVLRDWRRNEPTKMDPRLLDLVWETYQSSGATGYIQVVSGYRSPATNSMLRRRSRGVSDKSQHMLGKALDFFIPGVPLKKLRDIGLRMQGGGVGYYPTSGSPFVHFDTGNVRHWPGISRRELVRLFPNGKTLHVPSDGRPLPGYQQALAAYKARKGTSATIELASAGGSTRKSGGLLTALFGGGSDEADDSADVAAASPAPKGNVKTARAAPLGDNDVIAPSDKARAEAKPQPQEAEKDTPEMVIAGLPAGKVPTPDFAQRPNAAAGAGKPYDTPRAGVDVIAATEHVVAMTRGPASVSSDTSDPVNASIGSRDQAQIAFYNVPVPAWRPDSSLPADLPPEDRDVLRALADTDQHDETTTGNGPKPSIASRDPVKPVIEHAATVGEADVTGGYRLASLQVGSSLKSESVVGAVSSTGPDLTSRRSGGVKTAPKQARATPRDLKPGPKTMVVATPPQAARWALGSGENIASLSSQTTAPRFAYNIVHTPPREVYTAGFQVGSQMPDPARFTGNAVTFLSVARFETN